MVGTPLKLELPGSHGTMLPWFPPFSLPVDILQSMKRSLIEAVVTELLESKNRKLATQSSVHPSADSPLYEGSYFDATNEIRAKEVSPPGYSG